ncbi:hypothetical protein B0T17DRAFT_617129 [Bombardia bombarda]|uniref:Uncharacterized protein n=1 Tax=Bombardia bombarda TaxID=252184 RepID=A0AA40C4D6_9PEZI|nr:hypothetical protein B0T17DRAFT_617129 [Bombardia bombarda]
MHLVQSTTVVLVTMSYPLSLPRHSYRYSMIPTKTPRIPPLYRSVVARDIVDCSRVATEVAPKLTPGPTVPPSLKTWLQDSHIEITDYCDNLLTLVNLPGSVQSDLNKYHLDGAMWVSTHIDDLRSIWSACSDVPLISMALQGSSICPKLLAEITGVTKNSSPRETGVPIAAVAIAAGIVAMI